MNEFVNKNFLNLNNNYVFSLVSQKVKDYENLTNKKAFNLGIGDTTLPLSKNLCRVMCEALKQEQNKNFHHGYPPETGYDFLKEQIANFYKQNLIDLNKNEIFISNGIGCDITNILNLFSNPTCVIQNPTYPAYFDSNTICGNNIILLDQNNFNPRNLDTTPKLIYICSPNNPTGLTMNYFELKEWVDYANKTKSIILFDSAYSCFVDKNYPKSIYEIEGAKTCAIEFASFSKFAGFTNLRCSFTIVPKQINIFDMNLNEMWQRRQCTFFNGVPFHIQKGAEFALTKLGYDECIKNVKYYKNNAKIIKNCLKNLNFDIISSSCSPYVWIKCKNNLSSWQTFDHLLYNHNIVSIPGVAFGNAGEGYFRLSGFANRKDILLATEQLTKKNG